MCPWPTPSSLSTFKNCLSQHQMQGQWDSTYRLAMPCFYQPKKGRTVLSSAQKRLRPFRILPGRRRLSKSCGTCGMRHRKPFGRRTAQPDWRRGLSPARQLSGTSHQRSLQNSADPQEFPVPSWAGNETGRLSPADTLANPGTNGNLPSPMRREAEEKDMPYGRNHRPLAPESRSMNFLAACC